MSESLAIANPMTEKIKHVVVLMLENRSLDSVLGWLYEADRPAHFVPSGRNTPYNGLQNIDLAKFTNELKLSNGTLVTSSPPIRGASALDVPNPAPHEEYEHVNMQIFGQKAEPAPGTEATMKGVMQDYATRWSESSWEGAKDEIKKVMQTYTPDQLPMLNGLAKFYAVSDEWFGSVPTQTNANRAFSICGTSMGLVDNGFLAENERGRLLADDRFKADTIWNVLEDNDKQSWAVFWQSVFPPLSSSEPYTRRIFPHLKRIPNVDSHFKKMEEFHDMARKGTLPAFSYIEPAWTLLVSGIGWKGDDYHPPGNCQLGENLVRAVYQSLTANAERWKETLLIINFDEHVGSFDHVSPPWSAKAPWGEGEAPYRLQHNFKFNRFGPRVPAILVSPWIEKSTVFRSATGVPFDHTSVIATILTWAGVPREKWKMGARVDAAPTFEGVLTRSTPRTDLLIDQRPARGQILSSGDLIQLRAQDGRSVVALESAIYPYPLLDTTGAVAIRVLNAEGTGGLIREDALVTLRTTEIFAGQNTELGAWADRKECYYFAPNTQPDKQRWRIKRIEPGGDGYIRCGDKVYLVNQAYEKQHLNTFGVYLTTTAEAQSWGLEPVPDVVTRGNLRNGDLVNLRDLSTGDCVVGMQPGGVAPHYPFPRLGNTGRVALQLRAEGKEISHGDRISLVTREGRVGNNNVLGAWADRKECYYFASQAPDKQSWIIKRVSGMAGPIPYGEACYLENVAYSGQRLVRTDVFLTTAGGNPDARWSFEQVPAEAPSDVVRYGEPFYLRHVGTRKRIGKAYSGIAYWFPRLLADNEAVLLLANGAPAEIRYGERLALQSTESGLGGHDVLGAWADSKQCYYYRINTDKDKQSWEIRRKTPGGDGKLRYGEEFYLTNIAYTDQRLVRDGESEYLTTTKGGADTWVIERK